MAWSISSAPRPTEVDPFWHLLVYARERYPPPRPYVVVKVWSCGLSVEFCWPWPDGYDGIELQRLCMADIAAVELALREEWLADEKRRAAARRAAHENRRPNR